MNFFYKKKTPAKPGEVTKTREQDYANKIIQQKRNWGKKTKFNSIKNRILKSKSKMIKKKKKPKNLDHSNKTPT